MQIGVMITNGDQHSAEKWAIVTAGQIIQIGASATGTQAIDARKLENAIIAILEGHHKKVQSGEREAITKDGDARLAHALDHTQHADTAAIVAEIVAASKGSAFEVHFAKPETQAYLADLLGQHFRTSMDIERSWHADKHPTSDHAKAFKARRIGQEA